MASGNWSKRKKPRSRDVPRPPQRGAAPPEPTRRPEAPRASIFERPTVVPQTAPEDPIADVDPVEERAARREERAARREERAARRPTQVSQRPTRPSPTSLQPSRAGSGPRAPSTQRSAQLPQHVLGALRPRAKPAPGGREGPLSGATHPMFPAEGTARPASAAGGPPHSSLTLPSVESPGSVAGALRFVDAQARRSAPPPAFETATSGEGTRSPAIDLHPSLSDLYALDDFSGALEVAERRLAEDPNDAYAQRIASDCRQVLAQMYLTRIGRWNQRPRVVVDDEQLRWLSLDHHSGFLLSLIDGQFTLEELLDICGMSRVEALKLLAELTEKGVVAIE